MYYISPSNIGNPSLDVEKTKNFEIGVQYQGLRVFAVDLSCFWRQHRDTIDWVKETRSSPWEAMNVGSVNTKGLEVKLNLSLPYPWLRGLHCSYTYLDASDNPFVFSKYIFDYNQHKVVSFIEGSLGTVDITLIGNFSKPIQRDSYLSVDLKMKKYLNDNFKVFLEGTNMFNHDYDELIEVGAQGRWYRMGLEYTF